VDKYFNEHEKLVGVNAAISISVSSALGLINSMQSDAQNVLKENQHTAVDNIDDCMDLLDKVENPQVSQALADAFSAIAKQSQNDFTNAFRGTVSQVKNAVHGMGKTQVDINRAAGMVGESTDDPDSLITDPEERTTNDKTTDISEDSENDDPINSIPGIDEEPDTDPWDDVMNDPNTDTDGDDIIESAFEDIFNKHKISSKPSNEKIISDLFNDIVEKSKPSKAKKVTESVYDKLLNTINSLN
jgi:hypothetical protein